MVVRKLTARLLAPLAFCVAASSCLVRSLPIPPPGAQFSATSECSLNECPDGGVIVTVTGTGQPGAMIVVENVSQASRGPRYTATAFAATSDDVALGRASSVGLYVIRLGPVPERPDRPTPVLISRHGDSITVYQFVANGDGTWTQSLLREPALIVP